jgi:hypothetical protein
LQLANSVSGSSFVRSFVDLVSQSGHVQSTSSAPTLDQLSEFIPIILNTADRVINTAQMLLDMICSPRNATHHAHKETIVIRQLTLMRRSPS